MPTARRTSISATASKARPGVPLTMHEMRPVKALRLLLILLLAAWAIPAAALTFPELGGRRVVDAANLLTPQQEQQLTTRLEALERQSSRQLVIATVPSLEGLTEEDYGYQLGRHWGIGQRGSNNGSILLVAPNERKVRIEVGYGLEPIVTDAISSIIIQEQILPRFRDGDMGAGIMAGANALIEQLGAPPEAAEQRAVEAAQRVQAQGSSDGGGSLLGMMFWMFVLIF